MAKDIKLYNIDTIILKDIRCRPQRKVGRHSKLFDLLEYEIKGAEHNGDLANVLMEMIKAETLNNHVSSELYSSPGIPESLILLP